MTSVLLSGLDKEFIVDAASLDIKPDPGKGAADVRRTPLAQLARESRGVGGLRRVVISAGGRGTQPPPPSVTFNSSI